MSELTLSALRTVALVARTGSLSRAAAALGLAQSAASRHLAQVEASLGGVLFHRTGRGVSPTALGRQSLPGLQALLDQADALTRGARELAGSPAGIVTLGLVPSLAGPLASALHARLRQLHPEIQLRVRDGYSGDMESALTEGAVDLAVVNRYLARGPNRYRALCEAQICAVARPPLLAQLLVRQGLPTSPAPAGVSLAFLATTPLVMPMRPNALYSALDTAISKAGLQMQVVMEAGSSTVIKRMLADHDCVTVLPRHAIADELADGRLAAVPLAEPGLRQHIVLATSPNRPFTLAAKAVARLIPELARQLVAPGNAHAQADGRDGRDAALAAGQSVRPDPR